MKCQRCKKDFASQDLQATSTILRILSFPAVRFAHAQIVHRSSRDEGRLLSPLPPSTQHVPLFCCVCDYCTWSQFPAGEAVDLTASHLFPEAHASHVPVHRHAESITTWSQMAEVERSSAVTGLLWAFT